MSSNLCNVSLLMCYWHLQYFVWLHYKLLCGFGALNWHQKKSLKYIAHSNVIKRALIPKSLNSMSTFFTKKRCQKPRKVFSEYAEHEKGNPGQCDWTKVYVEYFTWLVVLRVCQENNIKNYSTELILRLTTIVSDKLEGEVFEVKPKTFVNLNKTIKKVLHKTFGSREVALFYLTCEDPLMVECIISVIRKQFAALPKSQNTVCRFFSNLGKALNKPLSCSFLNYGTCGLKDCAHLGAPLLRPRRWTLNPGTAVYEPMGAWTRFKELVLVIALLDQEKVALHLQLGVLCTRYAPIDIIGDGRKL